jgi:hypothetical protein
MKVTELLEVEDLFEMSNLQKEDTGLSKTIWVSVKLHSSGPRIKVNFDNSLRFDDSNNFSVTIDNNPRVVAGGTEELIIRKIGAEELSDVYDWVKLNQPTLLAYWNGEISTRNMLNNIRSL